MLKITLIALTTYAVVLAFIDPTAGGEPARLLNTQEAQETIKEGHIFVADSVFSSMIPQHERFCEHCDLKKCCDAKVCCKGHEKCCWDPINPDMFFCCQN
jgi:hypothetical protein